MPPETAVKSTLGACADLLLEQAQKAGVGIDKMLFLDGGGSTKIWIDGDPPKRYEDSEEKGARRLNFYIVAYERGIPASVP
jgi:hypothetical protein